MKIILLMRLLIEKGVYVAFEQAIVLTGGIATGKSSVAKLFLEDNFKVIDADKIAHEVLSLHQDEIVNLFGKEYLENGEINRKRLGALIFSEPKEKRRLEALMHPLIYNEIERESNLLDSLGNPYLIDIPLFFENEGRYPIHQVIVVYTTRELQLKRLMMRDNSTKEEALQRINSQTDIEKKRDKALYLIENIKDFQHLQAEYVKVRDKILNNSKDF